MPIKQKDQVTVDKLIDLLMPAKTPDGSLKILLYIVGFILTPITLAGALYGYMKAYFKYSKPWGEEPVLSPLTPIARASMILWAVAAWVVLLIILKIAGLIFGPYLFRNPQTFYLLLFNIVISVAFLFAFNRWKNRQAAEAMELTRFGTARFADPGEIQSGGKGIFIGGGLTYSKQGHIVTVAGTRGGKGVNLVTPNLLGAGGYEGSWVIVDPKGESAAVTAKWQRGRPGRKVFLLDPWGKNGDAYNPLDLLDPESEDFADDTSIISEMIVPIKAGQNDFFADRSRALLTGLIMHLAMTQEREDWSLITVWNWLRLEKEEWVKLLGKMSISDNKVVSNCSHEILNILETTEKTYGSIMAVAQQYTDFLKSPALHRSLAKSNFDANTITDGNTTIYVIIPADKLKTHYQWLRLVVTTLLRLSVRNRNQRITFLLDEFAALGNLPEIEVALSTYAGYNITIWAILQNLMQLKSIYKDAWETFIGNTAVKHYFTIRDNFTADYVSKSIGMKTFIAYEDNKAKATARFLITPDELMRSSGDNIFCRVDDMPATFFPKVPYYTVPEFNQRAEDNPFKV